MKLAKANLYCSDVKLVNSLFTFLFDCESRIYDGQIEVNIVDSFRFVLIEKKKRDNFFLFEAPSHDIENMKSQIELFNYRNNSNVAFLHVEKRLDILVLGSRIISII
jgi:hypothetical protein